MFPIFRAYLAALLASTCLSFVSATASCNISQMSSSEVRRSCTLINGETMKSEDDFTGHYNGLVTVILYYGHKTLNFIPSGLFDLYPTASDVLIKD
jgi:hypothetical protein